jgi:hypothetical protein
LSGRDDKIRQLVVELDAHVAEVKASVAILTALVADDEVPGGPRRSRLTQEATRRAAYVRADN